MDVSKLYVLIIFRCYIISIVGFWGVIRIIFVWLNLVMLYRVIMKNRMYCLWKFKILEDFYSKGIGYGESVMKIVNEMFFFVRFYIEKCILMLIGYCFVLGF